MKLRSIKPIYHQGEVLTEGTEFETLEQHGRELIQRGYAEESGTKKDSGDESGAKGKAKTK
ncbi:hypothetical protein CYR40_05530 [Chimaeribacter arupi]|uniref:DUF7210 family protein n=1 Tax=Enterobacterales TaxID=91347 RepID=UPI000C7CAAED|nr:hypothetical protein [Chimaeribacter arupi]PLR48630.1 hypothetical protein CYR40_05530 [Chimaeribacter arupi]